MKKINILIIKIIVFVILLGSNKSVLGVGRFVDIPVPPKVDNNTLNDEKTEKKQKDIYNTSSEFVVQSNNNYLKKLEVIGYKLEPEFNKEINDYNLKLENSNEKVKLNVVAEAEDSKSQIQGNGIVEIKEGEDLININVIAENGNLNVYTIRITKVEKTQEANNQENTETTSEEKNRINAEEEQINSKNFYTYGIGVIIIVSVIIVVIFFKKLKLKKK